MVPPEVLQVIFSGTVLASVGAGIKYVIDLRRTSIADRSPLNIAMSSSAAAEMSIALMAKVNAELGDETDRLKASNAYLHQESLALRGEVQASHERERKLREEVRTLIIRVSELEDSLRSISRDLAAFQAREFPEDAPEFPTH